MRERLTLLLQIPLALAILAWLPGNTAKLGALVLLWLPGFWRLSAREWLLFGAGSAFFTLMDVLALRQGILSFAHPDWLGLPLWELPMWGFYLVHSWRLQRGPAPAPNHAVAGALALLYALAFALVADAQVLLLTTAVLLAAALLAFHERWDLAYAGYLLLLGAAFETTGVHSGLWAYPGPPPGGVPAWSVTLWAGVGLFLRRLVLPLLRLT